MYIWKLQDGKKTGHEAISLPFRNVKELPWSVMWALVPLVLGVSPIMGIFYATINKLNSLPRVFTLKNSAKAQFNFGKKDRKST